MCHRFNDSAKIHHYRYDSFSLSLGVSVSSIVFVRFIKVLMIIIKALVCWIVCVTVSACYKYRFLQQWAELSVCIRLYCRSTHITVLNGTCCLCLTLQQTKCPGLRQTLLVISFRLVQSIQLYHMLSHRPIRKKELNRLSLTNLWQTNFNWKKLTLKRSFMNGVANILIAHYLILHSFWSICFTSIFWRY